MITYNVVVDKTTNQVKGAGFTEFVPSADELVYEIEGEVIPGDLMRAGVVYEYKDQQLVLKS